MRFENNSNDDIVLLSKSLSVIDAKGKMTSVNYDGFKGMLPELVPGDDFEDDGYVTSKTSAVLRGSCKISTEQNRLIHDIEIPVLSLIANDNNKRIYN